MSEARVLFAPIGAAVENVSRLLVPALLVAGAALVAIGAWLVYPPAGLMILGGLLLAAGLEAST